MNDILSQTATFVLAGGRGERLAPLTHTRSKPAVPFGDRRIIDFCLANCLRSDLIHPLVIAQYQAAHLIQHVRRWWREQSACQASATAAPVCVPAPRRSYFGTADAVFRNLRALNSETQYVVILSADHIYEMDYREFLRSHVEREADVTLGAVVCPSESATQFGILEIDRTNRIRGFEEKPLRPRELPDQPGKVLASMGIYAFRKDVLLDALREDAEDAGSSHDIGKNILPNLVDQKAVYAFRFAGYWKDVGTIQSYYEAAMERLGASGSVIARGVRVHPSAQVIDSILLPGVTVGPHARIRRAILDENVVVTRGTAIGNASTGIVVVPANSTVRPEPALDQFDYVFACK